MTTPAKQEIWQSILNLASDVAALAARPRAAVPTFKGGRQPKIGDVAIASTTPSAPNAVVGITGVSVVDGQTVAVQISHQYQVTFTGDVSSTKLTIGTELELNNGIGIVDESDDTFDPGPGAISGVAVLKTVTRTTWLSIGEGPGQIPADTYNFTSAAYRQADSGGVATAIAPAGGGTMSVTIYGP